MQIKERRKFTYLDGRTTRGSEEEATKKRSPERRRGGRFWKKKKKKASRGGTKEKFFWKCTVICTDESLCCFYIKGEGHFYPFTHVAGCPKKMLGAPSDTLQWKQASNERIWSPKGFDFAAKC